MLNQEQIELIHRELDGANTPADRAAFRSLLEQNPEARAFAADLRRVTQLFDQVEAREPPPHLKQAILDALPQPARASRTIESGWMTRLRLFTERTEVAIMSRKAMLISGTVAAIVIVVAARMVGFPPTGGEAGTIGGVAPAARYKGRAMTQADVTLQNPEIAALLQNHEVLRLVQSDVFREAMQDEAFRTLQSSEAYRQVMASDAYRQVMDNEAYRQLLDNEAFRQLQAQGSSEAQATDAMREVMASDAYRQLMDNEAFRALQENEAFRALQENEAFRQLQASDAFQQLQASDAFRELQSAEAFRALSRSAALSDQFMREAMRVSQ